MADGSSGSVSHMAGFRRVDFDEVLEHFTSRSMVSSGMGAQLERLRDGMSGGTTDPQVTQSRDEIRRLRVAGLLRCTDALHAYRSIRWVDCEDIRRFARKAGMGDGATVCSVMLAYQPRATGWAKQGLVDVYRWASAAVPTLRQLPAVAEVEVDKAVAQLFREGKIPYAERLAASLVADAHVVLREWVERWNKRDVPLAADHDAE